jgi:hypothetical protein
MILVQDPGSIAEAAKGTDWVTFAVSVAAFFVAAMSYFKSNAAARAQVFLEFRKRFSEIKHSIPDWYCWPAVPEKPDPKDLRAVELYWQNAFDEWFVTTKLERWHLRRLWKRFYEGTLTLSLKNGALRQVVAQLTHGGAEFGDHQEEFRAVLNRLCQQTYKQTLCGDYSCPKCTRRSRMPRR